MARCSKARHPRRVAAALVSGGLQAGPRHREANGARSKRLPATSTPTAQGGEQRPGLGKFTGSKWRPGVGERRRRRGQACSA